MSLGDVIRHRGVDYRLVVRHSIRGRQWFRAALVSDLFNLQKLIWIQGYAIPGR